jgi:hypothetical protein
MVQQAACPDEEHGRHAFEHRSGELLKRRIQGFGSEPLAPALPEDSLWGALVEVGVAMGVGTKEEMEESMVLAKDGFEEFADAAGSFFDVGFGEEVAELNMPGYPPNVTRPMNDAALERCRAAFNKASDADDGPGQYRIISDDSVAVSRTQALGGKPIGTLRKGDVVTVLGVAQCPGRLRARIMEPSGWISLLNLETGFRFAQAQEAENTECSGKRSTARVCGHSKADVKQNYAPSTTASTPSANEREANDLNDSDLLGVLNNDVADQADRAVDENKRTLLDVPMDDDGKGWTPFVAATLPHSIAEEELDEDEWSPFESAVAPAHDNSTLVSAPLAADLTGVEWTLPTSAMGANRGLSAVQEGDDECLLSTNNKDCHEPSTWQNHGYASDPSFEKTCFDPCAMKPQKFTPLVTRGISVFDPFSDKNADIMAALGV